MAMEMRGSLGLSRYYTKPNQPKFYGKCLINGVNYEIKGWEKITPGTGEVWISLCFEEPKSEYQKQRDREQEFAPDPKPRPRNKYGNNDDVPF